MENKATTNETFKERVKKWIEEMLEVRIECELIRGLKDGTVLCLLMNRVKPGCIRTIQFSDRPFRQMENVSSFIRALREFGVPENDVFDTVDLFQHQNEELVLRGLQSFARVLQTKMPEFRGPRLELRCIPKLRPSPMRDESEFYSPDSYRVSSDFGPKLLPFGLTSLKPLLKGHRRILSSKNY